MGFLRRAWLAATAGAIACGVLAEWTPAVAQSFPAKPIRIVVPAAAAGTSDILARITADQFERLLGQRGVVDNRPGAGGNLGADITAKAAPDGYTLCLITVGNVAINPFIYKQMPFDAIKDLEPVAPVASLPQVVVINGALPVHNLKELIAYAKASPSKLNYGSAGPGTTTQLAAELFDQMAGIKMVHVPYRGAGPAVVDLAAGQVQVAFVGLSSVQSLLPTGKVRVLAVAQNERLAAAPDVPTADESGLPGYEFATWFGLVGPRSMPADVVAKLNHAVNTMLDDPAVKKRLVDSGLQPMKATPEQFAARVKADYDKFHGLVQAAGLKPE